MWCGRRCSWGQRAASLGSSSAVWLAGWILKCSYFIGLAFGKRAVEDDRGPISLWTPAIWYGLRQSGKTRRGHLWFIYGSMIGRFCFTLKINIFYWLTSDGRDVEDATFCISYAASDNWRRLYSAFFYVGGTWSRPRVIGRFCFSSWQTRKMIPSPFYFSLFFIYRFDPASKPLPRFHKRHFGHSIREYKKLVQGTSMIGLTLSFSLFQSLSLFLFVRVSERRVEGGRNIRKTRV